MHEHTREQWLRQVYRILPVLIAEGANLPEVSAPDNSSQERLSQDEWTKLYESLKQKLGDWDLYRTAFNLRAGPEGVVCSLADDLADIYRDLADGLPSDEEESALDAVFDWRLLFDAHWGSHAVNALSVIHFRLSEST